MELAKHSKTSEDFIRLDMNFHEQIAKFIPNRLFHLLLTTLYSFEGYNSFLITKSSSKLFEKAQEEHLNILHALQNADAERAKKAIETHMKNVRSDLRSLK